MILHGDCIEIMRGMRENSVDLIYADPPFNTGMDWGDFDDRWEWDSSCDEGTDDEGLDKVIDAAKHVLGDVSAAYLTFMGIRLLEMKRIMKKTGSIYLHCDPIINSWLRASMDAVFSPENFRNEIVWCYAPAGRAPKRSFHKKHDTILYYASDAHGTWNPQYGEMNPKTRAMYRHDDGDGRLYAIRHGGRKTYLDSIKGRPVPSWWHDIPSFGAATQSKERTGWKTQKPLVLLERIVKASSNEGDVVLDPFMGSGTTLVAAKKLGRRFVGIDKSMKAVEICHERLSQ